MSGFRLVAHTDYRPSSREKKGIILGASFTYLLSATLLLSLQRNEIYYTGKKA